MRQMKKMNRNIIFTALFASLLIVPLFPKTTSAFGLGSILKVGGIGFLVDRFATPLNNFINTLMAKHNAGTSYATKVVPIVTVGSNGFIGAAQVTGSEELVEKTQAVLQLEGDFSGGSFRVKGLIPIDSKSPLNFSRVQGVGISAIIDVKIWQMMTFVKEICAIAQISFYTAQNINRSSYRIIPGET